MDEIMNISGIEGYEKNGTVYLKLENVARGLGFTRIATSGNEVVRWERVEEYIEKMGVPTSGHDGFIPENIVYRLAMKASNATAEAFQIKLADEVIPTIRRTGGYVNNDQQFIDTYLPYADDATKAMFQSTLAVVREQNRQLAEAKPKVQFFDAVADSRGGILVRDLAKLLKQNGIPTGERRLFEWLRKNGYLCSSGTSRNTPTQKAMDMGLFIIRVSQRTQDGEILEDKTTYVTGKGQQFFLKKFLPAVEVSQSFVQKNRENHG